MDKTKYMHLLENDNPLKIEKDLIEVQKTIIFYSEKILEKLNKLEILIKEMNQENKEIKDKENNKDPINQHLKKLLILRGYQNEF